MKCPVTYMADHRRLGFAVAGISAAALAFAYISQYGFNFQPCILCLWQRKPYFAAIVFGALAALFGKSRPRVTFSFLLLAGASFLTGMGISLFHTGVEREWWKGLQACGDSRLPTGVSLEELQAYLTSRPIVRCDVPGWKFLGFSMTEYNLALSSFLTLATFYLTFKGRVK